MPTLKILRDLVELSLHEKLEPETPGTYDLARAKLRLCMLSALDTHWFPISALKLVGTHIELIQVRCSVDSLATMCFFME